MKIHQQQAQELGQQIADLISAYHDKQMAAGTPMLLNDILSCLANVIGGLLANVPDEAFAGLFNDMGKMVLMSVAGHRAMHSGAALDVVALNDDEEVLQ